MEPEIITKRMVGECSSSVTDSNVPLRHFLIVCYCFCTILNYYVLSKSDVIKITCTHSMAMMISDGLN